MARTIKARRQRRWPLYALIAITVLPVAAAYIAYYVLPPSGRTNYGTLIEPQRPVPAFSLTTLDGTPFDLRQLKGKWVLIMADRGECDGRCADKLLMMRQQRAMTGKHRDQIERVWLVLDNEPLPIMLMREYEGTHFVRAPLLPVREFLLVPTAADARLEDHLWLIDPRGNLMLRWPRDPEPNGIKRDLAKLIKVSTGWIRIEPGTSGRSP